MGISHNCDLIVPACSDGLNKSLDSSSLIWYLSKDDCVEGVVLHMYRWEIHLKLVVVNVVVFFLKENRFVISELQLDCVSMRTLM